MPCAANCQTTLLHTQVPTSRVCAVWTGSSTPISSHSVATQSVSRPLPRYVYACPQLQRFQQSPM
eukprot:289881-Amphidinium_carterae.1